MVEMNIKMAKMNTLISSVYSILKGTTTTSEADEEESFRNSDESKSRSPRPTNENFDDFRNNRETAFYGLKRVTTNDKAEEYDEWLKKNKAQARGRTKGKSKFKEMLKKKDKFICSLANKEDQESKERMSTFGGLRLLDRINLSNDIEVERFDKLDEEDEKQEQKET
uniref:Uncharacterized protein n=1 Tax=Euplotes harpa TaxID=151035 RepID=A0A7S3JDK9_9SPIT|mmetsp:Transcript_34488/g.39904  ORF Transcript_34488/g.39904 Transcript_34488/m.39904 type:complete len:167 (+) Transcript_34488:256-756(+)